MESIPLLGETIWAFDLGKGSIGEAVRRTSDNSFPHVESLLIPADLARRGPATASGSPANKYRALKTREAHHARERWLETVWTAAGLSPLRGRQVGKVDEAGKPIPESEWSKRKGRWQQVANADPRLEREFAKVDDNTCYTSCLLRIRLLRSEGSLHEWQIYKALRSALQRRGYGKVPWAAKETARAPVKAKEDEAQDLAGEAGWKKFKRGFKQSEDETHDPQRKPIAREHHLPCYYDAFQMGLWNPAEPDKLETRVTHVAGSTRNVRFDRADVRKELIKLGDEAAKILPALGDAFARWQCEGWTWTHPVTTTVLTYPVRAKTFGEFLCDGPGGTPDESTFEAFLSQRKAAGLRTGTFEEWMAALGQKTPKFDNRILNDCVLIPRFHVCKLDVRIDRQTGKPVPESLLSTEVTFLMKLKNLLVGDSEKGQRKLLPQEVRDIFAYALQELKAGKLVSSTGEFAKSWPDMVAKCFALTKTEWGHRKKLNRPDLKPLPGHEEVKAPKASGRSAYSRVALRILKELILSGNAPSAFHARLKSREPELLAKLGSAPDKPLALFAGSTEAENTESRKRGLLLSELHFLLQMRRDDNSPDSWENIFVPSQTLEALKGRHTEDGKLDSEAAIRDLLGTINDPIVRHRLGVFAERLEFLQFGDKKNPDKFDGFGIPGSIVLEFVRKDFMGKEAAANYQRFLDDREKERKASREKAAELGLDSRSSGLRYELFKAQGGICLYTGQPLCETKLDEYEIDHIVPRSVGGPDAAVNYLLTTHDVNHTKEKGKLTPYALLHGKEGWDAYVERVNKRVTSLRNKKVQLLTRADASELVQRYTALAETAWVSKLAQTIVNLRFGWTNGNDSEGRKRVTVVSGGLIARVRRKYDLNRLLHGDDTPIEEAEKKNRKDHRHHALDAMVLTFIPQWARDPKKEGFFRFPEGFRDPIGREDYRRIREYFRREVERVSPKKLTLEKPTLADTSYGRSPGADGLIVKRVSIVEMAYKKEQMRPVFNLGYARAQVEAVRDPNIRNAILQFLQTLPDEAAWRQFCAQLRQPSTTSTNGAFVRKAWVEVGPDTEFKDLSKDGTGAYRKRSEENRGQLVYGDNKGVPRVWPVYVWESVAQSKQRLLTKYPEARPEGFFQSGCLVALERPINEARLSLDAGRYRLSTMEADGRVRLLDSASHRSERVTLKLLLNAGFKRIA